MNVKTFAVHHIEQVSTIVYLHIAVPHSQGLYVESHISVLWLLEQRLQFTFSEKYYAPHTVQTDAQIAH